MNVMVYGWASMAGMGTAIWLMARLCRTTLRHPLLLVAGGGFWNLGVLLGVGGILLGDSTGYQWLEFPRYAAVDSFCRLLAHRFLGGADVSVSARRPNLHHAMVFARRVSLVPVALRAAQFMLFVVPVQGVMQAAVNWWFANNLLFLWFGAIGLGTAYYMIPKVIGRPVYSYHLATIGFWTYALFSSWTGMQRLVDGPFPAWMITASIAATILTIIPVATVGLNHHMTMRGYFPLMRYSPTLRFTVFGAMSYTVFSLIGVLISLRSMASYVQFHARRASLIQHLGLYAFFTHDHVRLNVLHRAAIGWARMALRFADQTAFLGIGLRHRIDGADAARRRFGARLRLDNPSLAFTESTESVLPYLRGRSLSGMLADGVAFRFRLSLWSDASWLGPHSECADIS